MSDPENTGLIRLTIFLQCLRDLVRQNRNQSTVADFSRLTIGPDPDIVRVPDGNLSDKKVSDEDSTRKRKPDGSPSLSRPLKSLSRTNSKVECLPLVDLPEKLTRTSHLHLPSFFKDHVILYNEVTYTVVCVFQETKINLSVEEKTDSNEEFLLQLKDALLCVYPQLELV